MGSPKESMKDLSSDWTTGSCWRLFKVAFATKLPSGVVVAVAETILGALCCADSRCSCNSWNVVRVRSSSSCKSRFRRSLVALSFTVGCSSLKLVVVGLLSKTQPDSVRVWLLRSSVEVLWILLQNHPRRNLLVLSDVSISCCSF